MADVKTIERGFCSLCGRALLPNEGYLNLSAGSHICSHCIGKIRVMHPLTLSWDKKGNEVRHDPIEELSLEEAGKDLENAIPYTEELRARYDHHNAVFMVEGVTTEKGGFLKPPVIYASGRVIYGCFDPEDKARLLHKGSASDITLTDIRKPASYGAGGYSCQGIGGMPCVLEFSGKNLVCEAGDLIVKSPSSV